MSTTAMEMKTLEDVVGLSADAVIGNPHAAFRLSLAEQDVMKAELIRQNLAGHYATCALFRERCDEANFRPDDVETLDDVPKIPLISIRTFKDLQSHKLLSVPLSAIDMEIQSTGTGGIPSVARRDAMTTTRVALSLFGLYREFFGINNGVALCLCPSPLEVPEMGLVKVFNVFSGLLDDRRYVLQNYEFDPVEALEYLESCGGRHTRHILGPPFLINRLLRFMEENNVRLQLDPDSYVITLGGWKRFNHENIGRRQFDRKLEELLGIRPENVRDMYGMIESNTLAIECEHHRKHVPPWCHVTIRDIDDARVELPPGETGVIGLIDTLSHSYPSYILSEDVGRVEEGVCECGRAGQVITFERRLEGAEIGCCAVAIERDMTERACPLRQRH
jgi:long-chain-fatty-acid---luciferin-component ligase